MKKQVSLLVLCMISGLVMAQESKSNKQPNEQSKVTREYDEQGNLIRFDSTYVKSWSSDSTINSLDLEQMQQELDRMFGNFFSGDTTGTRSRRIRSFDDQFFKQFGDSGTFSFPNFQDAFPDMEEMQRQMMESFDQLMQSDTALQTPDDLRRQLKYDFMNTPEDLEKIRQEFEKQFEQFNDPRKNRRSPDSTTGSI